jgi:hypothetical protein
MIMPIGPFRIFFENSRRYLQLGAVDTGGNLPPTTLTPVAKLAKLVEKFAAGDTGAAPRISPRIFEKFETVPMEYSGAGG